MVKLSALLELGEFWHRRGRHRAHAMLGELLVTRAPAEAGCWLQFAVSHARLGTAHADRLLNHAIGLAPSSTALRMERGARLLAAAAVTEALADFDRAVALAPEDASAWSNRGAVHGLLGDHARARADLQQAVALDPALASAQFNLALQELLAGDAAGWERYRWRHALFPLPTLASPVWRGQPLQGLRLLLVAEQGFGDAIQFIRFVPALLARGARSVALLTAKPLADLFEGIDGLASVSAAIPPHDVHLPMMDLPLRLGWTDNDGSWRETVPYIHAQAQRRQRWREALARLDRRPRVGLCWQGSKAHATDRWRSVSLSQLRPLAEAGATLVALQREGGARDEVQVPLVDWSASLDREGAFLDSAALIAELDLVITVDTAIAHLAGAMGRPVWLLLAANPDWRWGASGARSSWYPSMRLYRQQADEWGDWSGVIARVAADLSRWDGHDWASEPAEEASRG